MQQYLFKLIWWWLVADVSFLFSVLFVTVEESCTQLTDDLLELQHAIDNTDSQSRSVCWLTQGNYGDKWVMPSP